MRLDSRVIAGIALVAVAGVAGSACGGRDSADTGNASPTANPDAAMESGADTVDAAHESSLFTEVAQCVGCFANQCSAPIDTCAHDKACQDVFTCTANDCLLKGNFAPDCFTSCAQADPTAATLVTDAVTCTLITCGESCMPAFAAASGIIGAGGNPFGRGGSGGHDAGGKDAGADAINSDGGSDDAGTGPLDDDAGDAADG
jgi:hypothetical protein